MSTGNREDRSAAASRLDDGALGRIRARAEASTAGPFGLVERGFGDFDVEPVDERAEPRGELAGVRGMFYRRENAEFFAHARADVLALLDALEEERRKGRSG